MQMGKAPVCHGPTYYPGRTILGVYGSWNLLSFCYTCPLPLGPHCCLSYPLAHLVYYGLVSASICAGKKNSSITTHCVLTFCLSVVQFCNVFVSWFYRMEPSRSPSLNMYLRGCFGKSPPHSCSSIHFYFQISDGVKATIDFNGEEE